MEIVNNDNVVLPEELQRKIDSARNSLTLAEQETIRLNELKYSQENQIKENLGKIDSLDNEIKFLKQIRLEIRNEVEETKIKVEETNKVLKENILKSEEVLNSNNLKKEELNQREIKIKEQEDFISEKLKGLEQKEKEVSSKELEVNKKIELIKIFSQSI